MPKVKYANLDLTGQRFGKVVALRKTTREGMGGATFWLCLCDCGKETTYQPVNLFRTENPSCGCFVWQKPNKGNLKHGKSYSREYKVWSAAKDRCSNPDNVMYHHYGGRGISICDRWAASFECFFEDMGPRPSSTHSLDRIDNNGNYCPENCRWATINEQRVNTRRSKHFIEFQGRIQPLKEWCKELEVNEKTIYNRINKGMTVQEALSKPKWERHSKSL